MAINRRMNNRNLEPRTDCFQMCEHLEDNTGFCQSGVYACGSGVPGNCNCTNMGPLISYYNTGTDLCSFSCGSWNAENNYWMCIAGCAQARSRYIGQHPVPAGRTGRVGRNFRTGGRVRRFRRGGNVRNECPHGYTMIGGVCR